MQHDISNLQDQVQQISLSQKVKKNELETIMNVNIDGIKMEMGVLDDGLKLDMEEMMNFKIEGLKEGLAKLLEERLPSDDKVFHETHEENKWNVNHDFRDSNFWMML